MKIERKDKEFAPITITFETGKDWGKFTQLVDFAFLKSDHSTHDELNAKYFMSLIREVENES